MRQFLNRFRFQAFWLNFPSALLILILQRTPVVKIVTLVEEMVVAVPLGSVLRSAVVVTAGVGVHSIAGATELAASIPSPLQATVGTPVSVGFSITGTLSEPERWFISGNFPPGVSFGGQTSGTVLGASILLSGTPSVAGNYTINLQANDDVGGNTPVYNYSVNVTDPTPTAPSFTTHPQSQSVNVGANVTFTSAASGNPAPTFQWRKAGVDISGATSSSLMLNNVQLDAAAIYTVVATNSEGSATSTGATLTVTIPASAPLITTHPQSQSVVVGANVVFQVAASGNPAPTFQWRKDGVAIAGATSAMLTLNNVQPADAATYTAVATNSAGSATSNGAVLSVTTAPVAPSVTSQPPDFSIAANGSVTFTVGATGSPVPAIQWQRSTDGGATWANLADGGVFADTATGSLRVTSVTLAMNGHRFRAVVTNSEGTATSNPGILSVAASAGPRLINLSTRAFAGAGDKTLIMGFFINGTGSKTLLIRGVGPRLLDFDVPTVVGDPRLVVYSGSTPIDTNNDWDPALASSFAAVGAFELNNGSKDAAMTITLEPGLYTIHLINDGPIAEALIEVYDLSRDLGTRLTNLSCRFVMNPGQTLIVGTALIGGDVPVLVRNVGPELVTYGFHPNDVLADPHLRIFQGDTVLNENDDWNQAIEAFFVPAGAFGLTVGSKDAAVRQTLNPGGYTVHATGKTGGGVAIVEIYESP